MHNGAPAVISHPRHSHCESAGTQESASRSLSRQRERTGEGFKRSDNQPGLKEREADYLMMTFSSMQASA
ncbi:hypothetical protein C8256_08620 [Kluyvera genomosp. 2]|uniref:Uncharacterized protein n=1 Tax=Kluyvera genomosp. 2 TaxID=2774054 RepID=A0A2T2Y3P3_9ENTR|nr:hypothetical protein C8256_08620 [Kluyvera genomosp. 2]